NRTTIPTLIFHAPRSALRTLWGEQYPFVPASVQSSVKGILWIVMRRRPNCFEVGVPVRMETTGNRIPHDQISEQVDPFHFHLVNRDHQQARQATENANRTYRDQTGTGPKSPLWSPDQRYYRRSTHDYHRHNDITIPRVGSVPATQYIDKCGPLTDEDHPD